MSSSDKTKSERPTPGPNAHARAVIAGQLERGDVRSAVASAAATALSDLPPDTAEDGVVDAIAGRISDMLAGRNERLPLVGVSIYDSQLRVTALGAEVDLPYSRRGSRPS